MVKPLQPSRDEKRVVLTRHFTEAVEPLLMAGESYSDISVARLLEAVDISRSTFYSYYDDKAALLKAMGEDVTLDLAEAGRHWFELGSDADRKALRGALAPLFETYRRHQMLLRAITEAAAYDAGIRELHTALVQRAGVGLVEHLRTQRRRGTVAKVDPERTARWLVWMLERGLYHLVAPADVAEVEKQLDAASELVWRALYEGFR